MSKTPTTFTLTKAELSRAFRWQVEYFLMDTHKPAGLPIVTDVSRLEAEALANAPENRALGIYSVATPQAEKQP